MKLFEVLNFSDKGVLALERIAAALEVVAIHYAKEDKIFYTPPHRASLTSPDEADVLNISDAQRVKWDQEAHKAFEAEGLQYDLFDEEHLSDSQIAWVEKQEPKMEIPLQSTMS